MNRQELELIAALAEGSLDDETEARRMVASSPEFQAEYEAQRTAIETLRQVPEARLTEHERSALRRDVWTELRAQPAGRKLATPWYYRWSTVAAGLVLIVGLVAVLNRSDSTVGLSQADDATELAAETERVATTNLAAEEAADGAAAPLASDDFGAALDSDDSEEATGFLAEVAVQARLGSAGSLTYSAAEAPDAKQSLELCLAAAGLEGHEVIGQLQFSPETTYIVAAPSEVDLTTDTPISFVDAASCELFYTDG